MDAAIQQGITIVTTYGINIIGAILILIIGRMAASWVSHAVAAGLRKSGKVDETLRPFFANFTKYVILTITILAVLSQFGIETTSLIAVFGAASLAIGLALQGTLSNVAAGVMLLIFRPFKVGQYVETAGIAGLSNPSPCLLRSLPPLTTCKSSLQIVKFGEAS